MYVVITEKERKEVMTPCSKRARERDEKCAQLVESLRLILQAAPSKQTPYEAEQLVPKDVKYLISQIDAYLCPISEASARFIAEQKFTPEEVRFFGMAKQQYVAFKIMGSLHECSCILQLVYLVFLKKESTSEKNESQEKEHLLVKCPMRVGFDLNEEEAKLVGREDDSLAKQQILELKENEDDSKKALEILSGSPQLPESRRDTLIISEDRKQKFLDGFCDNDDEKELVSYILKHTSFYDWNDFQEWFKNALEQLRNIVKDEAWSPRPALNETEKITGSKFLEKSNFWMLHLALHFVPPMKDTVRYGLFVSSSTLLDVYGIRNFVFFDDALYSGSQMRRNLEKLIEEMMFKSCMWKPYSKVPVKLIVVAAQISSEALDTLNELKHKYSLFEMHFCCGAPPDKVMKSIDAILNEDKSIQPHKKAAFSENMFHQLNPSWPVYWAHKMPDYHSSFPTIYRGIIPKSRNPKCDKRRKNQIANLIPLCKFSSEEQKHILANDEIGWQEFSTYNACPPPPYKTRPCVASLRRHMTHF